MHVKNPFLFGLMAILLLGGTITPALSQSSLDSNSIVINEVELNPQNGSEYVELYNPTSQPIDISGWSLIPTTSWKILVVGSNTVIEPQSFLIFTHVPFWFKDFGDSLTLTNNSGELIDETPLLIDQDNDGKSWQRITDGLDSNSNSDWELKRMSPKSSNGTIIESTTSEFIFTGQSDKTNYTFDEYVTISGSISEILYTEKPFFSSEIVNMSITGPNYSKNLSLFPDRNLEYSTELNLQKVYGFSEGVYNVKISYGGNIIDTNFQITDNIESESSEILIGTLEISTDKESYIPGDTMIILAETDSSIDYAGLNYVVIDPNYKQISQGTIFPNTQFSTVHQAGGGKIFPFSSQLLLPDLNPVYGTYQINGIYQSQNPLDNFDNVSITSSTTFELVQDIKEDVAISLSTDKELYQIGEIVKITGRSNDIWTEDVELRILQTGIISDGNIDPNSYQGFKPLDVTYSVKLNGDGTFEYDFKLPTRSDSTARGDYLIKVSEYFGESTVMIKVVEYPESFVDIRTPLGLKMDKSEYVLGTAVSLSGQIVGFEQYSTTLRPDLSVHFTISDSDGKTLMSQDRQDEKRSEYNYESTSPNDKLRFNALPDVLGNFQINFILNPIQFDLGTYVITASYPVTKTTESTEFEIVSAQSQILSTEETQEPLVFELCSSTRSSTSEIIKDLTQIGRGEIPPSMESVDCDGTTDFVTGEKLVIRGKVALKEITSLTSTYADRSSDSQTSDGHSYSTNYAQSQMNYVELSIPYPHTLIVSSSYRTIPDAGEDYHGGGGSGTQCKSGGGNTAITTNPTTGVQSSHTVTSECQTAVRTTENGSSESERHTGYDGQAVLRDVKKNLTDMKIKAYPDSEGNFNAVFSLGAGIFADGIYTLKANYFGYHDEQSFSVNDTSLQGGSKPELILDTDKTEYIPGEIVSISGQVKNVYYYDTVSVKIETPSASISQNNCIVGKQCGDGTFETDIRVNEGTSGATFNMNYQIPLTVSSLGMYNVIADTHFGEINKSFFVISESDVIEQSSPLSPTISKKVIEKFNRISENEIPINVSEKSSEESTLVPRVIQGSLFTSARGEESDVNLRITTSTGQCVIGQESDCLVNESTRKPGAIYSVVSLDDGNYKIRYSGNDVRLEKFSIVPEDSTSKINIESWNVEIIKDEQPSRFYYKVSYVALE